MPQWTTPRIWTMHINRQAKIQVGLIICTTTMLPFQTTSLWRWHSRKPSRVSSRFASATWALFRTYRLLLRLISNLKRTSPWTMHSNEFLAHPRAHSCEYQNSSWDRIYGLTVPKLTRCFPHSPFMFLTLLWIRILYHRWPRPSFHAFHLLLPVNVSSRVQGMFYVSDLFHLILRIVLVTDGRVCGRNLINFWAIPEWRKGLVRRVPEGFILIARRNLSWASSTC